MNLGNTFHNDTLQLSLLSQSTTQQENLNYVNNKNKIKKNDQKIIITNENSVVMNFADNIQIKIDNIKKEQFKKIKIDHKYIIIEQDHFYFKLFHVNYKEKKFNFSIQKHSTGTTFLLRQSITLDYNKLNNRYVEENFQSCTFDVKGQYTDQQDIIMVNLNGFIIHISDMQDCQNQDVIKQNTRRSFKISLPENERYVLFEDGMLKTYSNRNRANYWIYKTIFKIMSNMTFSYKDIITFLENGSFESFGFIIQDCENGMKYKIPTKYITEHPFLYFSNERDLDIEIGEMLITHCSIDELILDNTHTVYCHWKQDGYNVFCFDNVMVFSYSDVSFIISQTEINVQIILFGKLLNLFRTKFFRSGSGEIESKKFMEEMKFCVLCNVIIFLIIIIIVFCICIYLYFLYFNDSEEFIQSEELINE